MHFEFNETELRERVQRELELPGAFPADWNEDRRTRYAAWRLSCVIRGFWDAQTRAMRPPLRDVYAAWLARADAEEAEAVWLHPTGLIVTNGLLGSLFGFVGATWLFHAAPAVVAFVSVLGAIFGAAGKFYAVDRARSK